MSLGCHKVLPTRLNVGHGHDNETTVDIYLRLRRLN